MGYNEYGMNFSNTGMGVYTAYNQFDLDPVKLQSLGFNQNEIDTLYYIMANGGKVTTQALTSYGISYEDARKLRYMFDICTGKVVIDSPDDLAKHMKKMFGHIRRLGIQDLAISKISSVPRTALVAGIPRGPFDIWNSSKYPPLERMYTVVDVSGGKITIETDRKPVLKFKQDKFIDGVLEIKELTKDGKVRVAIDKKYCRLCNRFIIVASLRRPEFHHGMVEMICIEGTRVYVYAKDLGTKDQVRYNMGTQRVYAYGFYPNEIQSKLMLCATNMYKELCGVYATTYPANQDFLILTPEKDEDDTDEIEIE